MTNTEKKALLAEFEKFLNIQPDDEINDIPYINPHALRHSFASYAIQNGADIKAVSANLGHKSIAMTADIYAQATTKSKKRNNKI